MRRPTRPTRRAAALTGAAALGVAGVLLLVLGLTAGGPLAPTRAGETVAAPAVPSTPVPPASSPTPAPAPSSLPTARHTPSSAVRLVVPSVGLDLPLLGLTPRRGVIDPPLLTAGYWLEPYGAPVGAAERATNTLYVAAHSAGRGDDGFDPLLTPDHRGAAVGPGDVVEVRTPEGTVSYTVTGTQRVAKGALPDAAGVWESSPGRLVLITCFQRADGREATENLVVVAEA
ncbi:class F sortase [Geodermatophilus marinus]|uniref:class F sortase n=1 Tax=Geodermatophilus sp. LHW52908 TaxID=2303986 RepID=UPI000E3B5A44|nr:class F sortase [Geodermatophilus sp. LHW52908]RFU19879.1 class F sortase [Geodermatophilus sp. LHW52908]